MTDMILAHGMTVSMARQKNHTAANKNREVFKIHLAEAIKDVIEKNKNGSTGDLHNVVQRLTGVVANATV